MSSRGTTPRSRRTSTQGKGSDVASEAEEGEVIRKMLGPQEVLTGAQFYEFLRDTQAAMKQSLALQKSLIDKVNLLFADSKSHILLCSHSFMTVSGTETSIG